ncbi:MAG TPA: hypothetical protein DCX03_04460 [Bacteroidales bacterium]|nr:hypothetical protein [Bacteroidales bacterium]
MIISASLGVKEEKMLQYLKTHLNISVSDIIRNSLSHYYQVVLSPPVDTSNINVSEIDRVLLKSVARLEARLHIRDALEKKGQYNSIDMQKLNELIATESEKYYASLMKKIED